MKIRKPRPVELGICVGSLSKHTKSSIKRLGKKPKDDGRNHREDAIGVRKGSKIMNDDSMQWVK